MIESVSADSIVLSIEFLKKTRTNKILTVKKKFNEFEFIHIAEFMLQMSHF